ncbi:YlcG family protein [Salmonella enterica subsp. enterica serovar Brazzaville]|nr:YlcG family protein [Salmonella enterica subsp. enterica serovar Brazzaville]
MRHETRTDRDWQRLRIYRRPGAVLVDYRILRNFVRIYQFTGFTQ